AGRRPEHDPQRLLGRGREFQRVVLGGLNDRVAAGADHALGLAPRIQELGQIVDDDAQYLAKLLGQSLCILFGKDFFRNAGGPRENADEIVDVAAGNRRRGEGGWRRRRRASLLEWRRGHGGRGDALIGPWRRPRTPWVCQLGGDGSRLLRHRLLPGRRGLGGRGCGAGRRRPGGGGRRVVWGRG